MVNGHAEELRTLISRHDVFLALPGVYDCLSARIAEEAGFKALFLSGGALAYSRLGKPDIGFMNLVEFCDAIQRICAVVKVPLIADADNVFGNAIHAAHTASVYEQVGASGIQIDDKELPSIKPGSNEVLPWNLVGPKISAMRSAVTKEFVIVYRTCANLYGLGIEESVERVNLSAECGADFAYVDGIKSTEELAFVSDNAKIPMIVNLNEKGFCGGMPLDELRKYKFLAGLFPISSMSAAAQGMITVLGALYREGSTAGVRKYMTYPPTRVHEMMGEKSLVERYSSFYK